MKFGPCFLLKPSPQVNLLASIDPVALTPSLFTVNFPPLPIPPLMLEPKDNKPHLGLDQCQLFLPPVVTCLGSQPVYSINCNKERSAIRRTSLTPRSNIHSFIQGLLSS